MKQRLSLLIVDDLEKKREAIKQALSRHLNHFDIVFDTAERYESGRERLQKGTYDFVILDIKIPAGSEPASEKWSRQLLRDIVEGRLGFPMHVFGITEHREIADVERQYYESNMFGFSVFEWGSDQWAASIASKIEYLAHAIRNGTTYRLSSFDYDILVLTARHKSEFVPIQKSLFGNRKSLGHPLWKEGAHFGQLVLENSRKLRAALICIGETGLPPAASATTQAIHLLRPRVVVMLGMCAGFKSKGVKIMDILVAREAACWQEGKILGSNSDEDLDPRGKIRNWSSYLGAAIGRQIEMRESAFSELFTSFSRTSTYLKLRKKFGANVSVKPEIRPGLIVSGSAVVANKNAASKVRRFHPSALGLEMEIFAVYTAASLALGKQPELVAIKGVADFADSKKRDQAQALASELSAEVLKLILKNVPIEQWFSLFGGEFDAQEVRRHP